MFLLLSVPLPVTVLLPSSSYRPLASLPLLTSPLHVAVISMSPAPPLSPPLLCSLSGIRYK
jgi:hypothetical protein